MRVVSRVSAYRKVKLHTHETVGYGQIDLPEQVLETEAYWMAFSEALLEPLRIAGQWRSDPNDYGPIDPYLHPAEGSADRFLLVDLLVEEIEHRRAVVYVSTPADLARHVQHRVGQSRLAGAVRADQGHVADLVHAKALQGSLPRCGYRGGWRRNRGARAPPIGRQGPDVRRGIVGGSQRRVNTTAKALWTPGLCGDGAIPILIADVRWQNPWTPHGGDATVRPARRASFRRRAGRPAMPRARPRLRPRLLPRCAYMKPWLLPASLCAMCLLLGTSAVRAQDPAEPAAPAGSTAEPATEAVNLEPEMVYEDYTIKGYTIAVFGGAFSGDEYLNLPVRGDRTFEDEGADRIMGYDGDWLTPAELDRAVYDGPVKTLEDGTGFGFKVGSWLNDNVHVDLVFSYVGTEAVLTMVNKTLEPPAAEEISRDTDVTVFRAGFGLSYELRQFELLGIHPYVGFGFGGVIVRYSAIDDTGELFFNGNFGLTRPISPNLSVFAQFDLTTFAMSRDELQYTERVNLSDLRIGLSWFIDVVPAEVRALHEEDLKATRTRRR